MRDSDTGTVITRIKEKADDLATASEGSLTAYANDLRNLTVYDLVTSSTVLEIADFPTTISAVALSPSGKEVAVGLFDGELFVFEISNGRTILESRQHSSLIRGIYFINESSLVSLADDGTAGFWFVDTTSSAPVAGREVPIDGAWSSQGDALAVVMSSGAIEWPNFSGTETRRKRITAVEGWSPGLAIAVESASGKLAMATGDGPIAIYDLTGHVSGFFERHERFVTQIAFSRTGLAVSVGADDRIFCWRWPEAELVWEAKAYNRGFISYQTSARLLVLDDRVYCCGLDGVLRVYELSDGKLLDEVELLTGAVGMGGLTSTRLVLCTSGEFPSSTLAVAGIGTSGTLFTPSNGRLIRGPAHAGVCTSIQVLDAGEVAVTGGTDGVVVSWTGDLGSEVWRTNLGSQITFVTEANSDDLIAVGCVDGRVAIMNPRTGQRVRTLAFNSPVFEGAWGRGGEALMLKGSAKAYVLERVPWQQDE